MTDLRDAINYYHALLDPATAQETHEQLTEQLRRRGLFFGERPLSTLLRPRFMHPSQYQTLRKAIRAVMPAFQKAHAAALADPNFRSQFRLSDWEEELVLADPGFKAPSPTARMDSFFDEAGVLWLTEYNAETPAAIAYNDLLSEVYFALPVMREFSKRYEVRPLAARHLMLHALLDSYKQWGGTQKPRIGILDWKEVPTYSEFVLFHDYFESHGYDCLIIDPREVTYENGKLMASDQQIHILYKRVLISELIERGGVDHPVVRAVREKAVCMVNPFACKILHKKASLAVLSDEANATLFTASERAAIDKYIPWTRVLKERKTAYLGQQIDLVPFLIKNKDTFVIKPNDEYGGKGVVLGWETAPGEWEAALQTGLAEPAIVQKRVPLPKFPYASWVDGKVEVYDRMVDTNPYIWYGNYVDGCLTRISTAALLNVTAGGGSTVATFVVDQRE
ncbi:MAG TPA: circularly permuted type 2 ATP-grasp protein [Anaerolineales bacterium]|nr:circularly permuted type 2 ATP-grasp protein [Anaerolineales bacterium]